MYSGEPENTLLIMGLGESLGRPGREMSCSLDQAAELPSYSRRPLPLSELRVLRLRHLSLRPLHHVMAKSEGCRG